MTERTKKSSVGGRIKELREKIGMTQEVLGELCGTTKQSIYKYENGIVPNIPLTRIEKIANALNTTPEYLMGWETSDTHHDFIEADNIFRIETRKFPLLGDIACGQPILADERVELYVTAAAEMHADFCLRAKGDSMIGARIFDGDIVFIRRQDTVNDGEIAAVMIDGEATLKRVYYDREHNIISLYAENPQYKALRYSGEQLNQIRILGKAVGAQIAIG